MVLCVRFGLKLYQSPQGIIRKQVSPSCSTDVRPKRDMYVIIQGLNSEVSILRKIEREKERKREREKERKIEREIS